MAVLPAPEIPGCDTHLDTAMASTRPSEQQQGLAFCCLGNSWVSQLLCISFEMICTHRQKRLLGFPQGVNSFKVCDCSSPFQRIFQTQVTAEIPHPCSDSPGLFSTLLCSIFESTALKLLQEPCRPEKNGIKLERSRVYKELAGLGERDVRSHYICMLFH